MAAAASLSTIVTPATSSSSVSFIPSENSFTYFSPKPKLLHKTLTLKSQNFTLSPLPLLFPLHFCHSSSAFNDTEDSITDESEENPIELEQEQELQQIQEQDELEEIINSENKGVDSVDDCRLFVGNLPYSMTSDQLSEVFAEAGQVRFIEIIYDKVTDRSRGFGFVTMGSVDEAKEAIRLFDGSQVGGRTVRVNFPEVPRGGERKVMGPKLQSSNVGYVDTPHKLYAGNLGWGVTSQGLREAFANQEGFLSAKVIYERASGRSRGFGFITFSTAEAAESALTTMNGVELEGRPLRLNMASDRARSNTEAYAEQSA
ncbi:33 kDa ribonucleoprotein, chloroplastic-like [Chenopodium quinoa]|uniref:33 kDa ribonucleoprotein, chloroplastic-like n=1 Tax=Chenopodium quinoa TaxID=63459 RepID=UPI000B7834E1|nr:33 kDa ribonucleoprotein, chloroplastic-like [Chenopodium quinoa]